MEESPLSSWLALREPADLAARSASLTRAVIDTLPHDRPLRIVDLGTGSGSNVRYLNSYMAQRFPGPRKPAPGEGGSHAWLLVDADAALLAEAQARLPGVETRQMNLGMLDRDLIADRDLVTGSALLDLVSDSWLQTLARYCRAAGAAALFALNYNGESRCSPSEPEDEMIRSLMNRHQRQNDKGFGRAAGPDAPAIAARHFEDAGYVVRREKSDWQLAPESHELQRQLIEGWAGAALELVPAQSTVIRAWLTRRIAHVDAGRSRITVGHDDLGAWQP
jgi:hypothetical protein